MGALSLSHRGLGAVGAQQRGQLGAGGAGLGGLHEEAADRRVEASAPIGGGGTVVAARAVARATARATAGAAAGREEEVGRPDLLEGTGGGDRSAPGGRRRRGGHRRLGEERVGEVVPRDGRDDAVHARARAGEHEPERAAVGPPMTPARGSPGASSSTSLRVAARSSSAGRR